MLSNKKKKAAVVVALTAGLTGSGVAFAYWTATGTGTGTAVASSGGAGFVITGNPADGIFPGATVPVTTVITSRDAAQPQQLSTLQAVVSVDAAHAAAGCSAAWFTYKVDGALAPAATTFSHVIDQEVAPGAAVTLPATLSMANAATSQDACKGATVALAYTSN